MPGGELNILNSLLVKHMAKIAHIDAADAIATATKLHVAIRRLDALACFSPCDSLLHRAAHGPSVDARGLLDEQRCATTDDGSPRTAPLRPRSGPLSLLPESSMFCC
jgi:hypothetical protein